MKRKNILYWRNKYDKEEDLYNKGDEEELRAKFQKKRCMTKGDLERIVKWKFQGRLKGRQKRILNLLKSINNDYIVNTSRLAFQSNNDEERIRLLTSIKGVGNALASVILTFLNPKRYCVLDIHAWREAFKEKEPADVFSSSKQAIKFFERIRDISRTTGFSCRDIEKAMFKKNLDEGK